MEAQAAPRVVLDGHMSPVWEVVLSANQLKSVYRALLANTQVPLVPDMQKRIMGFAHSSNDSSLLVALLSRRDVDPEVEVAIAGLNDLEVLASWASDPRRTSDELSSRLKDEKRVGALLPLAGRHGLPDEAYRALASRGSVRISAALVENLTVPDEVRTACLEFLVSRSTWQTSSTPHFLAKWMISEDNVRAVAEHSVHTVHVRVASESSMFTMDMAESLALRVDELFERENLDLSSWYTYPMVPVLSALRKFSLSDKARECCLSVVNKIEALPSTRSNSWSRSINTERLREAFDPSIEGFDTFLRRLADPSSDVVGLAGKVFGSAGDDQERRLAVEALVSRRDVPEDILREHVSQNASGQAVHLLFRNLLEEGRLRLLADLALEVWPSNVDTLRLILDHPGGHDVVRMVSETARDMERPLPSWVRELLRHDRFSETAIEVVQWSELSELLMRAQGHASELSARVQRLLLDELGDDEERWRVFSELAGSFSGSLRMLVDTVSALR